MRACDGVEYRPVIGYENMCRKLKEGNDDEQETRMLGGAWSLPLTGGGQSGVIV